MQGVYFIFITLCLLRYTVCLLCACNQFINDVIATVTALKTISATRMIAIILTISDLLLPIVFLRYAKAIALAFTIAPLPFAVIETVSPTEMMIAVSLSEAEIE